jgi:hypothetical protein
VNTTDAAATMNGGAAVVVEAVTITIENDDTTVSTH